MASSGVQLAALLALALFAVHCKKAPTEERPRDEAPSLPADRLAPGELPEGDEEAFGVKLPRGMRVERGFSSIVHAVSTTLTPEPVADYLRARVTDGSMAKRTDEIRFTGVHPAKDPKRELTIQIREGERGVSTCDVLFIDATPPEVVPDLTEDERRARAGLSPDGKLIDPQHLE